jgi:dolichol-phosphate mannosyltransferase
MLSVVIPAHDEAGTIADTVRHLSGVLREAGREHEIVVVNDHSTDDTAGVLAALAPSVPELRVVENLRKPGYGLAVRAGLQAFTGDAVAVFMADGSDDAHDLVRFAAELERRGVDCVFGTRFSRGGRVLDYPRPKLLLNRVANTLIRIAFGLRYDDVTNAFKLYRREAVEGMKPFLSHHFNLTVEMPLKAIVRGYTYSVVPNTWRNRERGASKFRIKEMGSRYAFIVLYCLLERALSRGDYRREPAPAADPALAPTGAD